MKLTTTQINNLKHSKNSNNIEMIKDISNLYIVIKAANTKSWLYRYNFNNKSYSLGLGSYPKISLKKAREITQHYNSLRSQGQNPKDLKQKTKLDKRKLFHNIIQEWYSKKSIRKSTAIGYRMYLDNDIIPFFKNIDINDIEILSIGSFLQNHIKTKAKQRKLKAILSGIFKYAVALGLCKQNIMLNDFSHILSSKSGSSYAFINPVVQKQEFILLLTKMDKYIGKNIYKVALKLATLLAFRPNVLVSLKWQYFNISERLLIIPASLMKMKEDFKQPLSNQAYQLIIELYAAKKESSYILSNKNSKLISANKLRNIIQKDFGFDGTSLPRQTMHGFRHSISTAIYYLQRQYKWQSEAIELILDHRKRNKIQAIYNTYEYIDERREILQIWADYLDELKVQLDN